MSLEFALRPSSIEGIKRLADRIQRDEAIQRAEALERASRSAGYSNYAHARRSLADSLVPERPRQDIHITAYWHDLPTGETGRETLVIVVDHRLDERIDRRQLANNRHLLSFRRKESDHVEGKQVFGDQRTARKAVCGAARALYFIDATGLQPYSRSLVSPIERWQSDPFPGSDHASTWRDAASGELVITDEPYRPAISSRDAERLAWAERHGLTLSASKWPGMYAPGAGSSLHLLARDAQLAQRVLVSTDRSPMHMSRLCTGASRLPATGPAAMRHSARRVVRIVTAFAGTAAASLAPCSGPSWCLALPAVRGPSPSSPGRPQRIDGSLSCTRGRATGRSR
jgi:hypothetical protein